jgi:hypothetical protein
MKFIKTLILSAVAFGTITFSSCSKNNEVAASATITANIDGTLATFNKNVLGTTGSVNGATFTTIQGTDASGNNISITLAGTLTAGKTYTSNAASDNDKPVVLYTTADNETYVNDDSNVSNIISVTVASATSSSAQGSFSGKLTTLLVGNGTAKTKTVTDGKFNVTLIQ